MASTLSRGDIAVSRDHCGRDLPVRLAVMRHGIVLTGAAILAAAVAAGAAGCGKTQGQAGSPSPVKPVRSLGCYTGATLSAEPAHARPGEIVTLAALGLPRDRLVIMQNLGSLGTAPGGHFTVSYNLAAVPHGSGRRPNYLKAGPDSLAAGTGLPNRPFDIAVPPVGDGNYLVQFEYSAQPASPGPGRPVFYTLCAPLPVSR